MLSSLLKDKKTKKAQLVVSSSKSQKPSPRARMPWHGGKGTGSSINKTNCGGNLCDKQEKKEGEQTLTQPFMITLCENCDTERRRDHVGVKRPKQLKRTDRSYLPLRSSTIFFFRCSGDGASFQLSLPTRSAMGAHSWPLVFP